MRLRRSADAAGVAASKARSGSLVKSMGSPSMGQANSAVAGEVDGPGAVPATVSGQDHLTGIVGVARRQRLKDMEDVCVAGCPEDEREGDAECGRQQRQGCTKRAVRFAFGQRRPEHRRQQCSGEQALLRPQQNGVGERGGDDPEPAVIAETRILPARESVESEGDGGEDKRLGEGDGGVVRGEGAECRDPENGQPCAGTKEASGERAGQAAGAEVDGYLYIEYRAVVLHAEEPKAGSQKHGVAGKPDEGGAGAGGVVCGEAVDSMLEPGLGDVAVDEAVADDPCHVVYEPQT